MSAGLPGAALEFPRLFQGGSATDSVKPFTSAEFDFA
jgi:hypothetical protein